MHNGPATGETIMHFSKGVFLFGAIIALCPPAFAVTKCVKLSSSTTCSNHSSESGQSNWSATCGGISIQGIGFCGSQYGGSVGATTDAVTTSSSNDANKYCWCRMISPAVSQWVFLIEYSSAGNCANRCASVCAPDVLSFVAFKSALFSNLSD